MIKTCVKCGNSATKNTKNVSHYVQQKYVFTSPEFFFIKNLSCIIPVLFKIRILKYCLT